MRGVLFGDYHTGNDWGLILNAKSLTPPEPKTNFIDIDGRDGSIDLSETLTGEVRYYDRIASFTFLMTDGSHRDRELLTNEIVNKIHGKRLNIVLPDEPDHYLVGRCNVTGVANDRAYGVLEIECTCEPWKYAERETSKTYTANGSTVAINCINTGRKTVIPTVTVTGSLIITIGTSSVSLSAGEYKLSALRLKAGSNGFSIKGTGSITLKYREAVL